MNDAGCSVRLSFPQGEHRDVTVEPGEITIGASSDNAVVLAKDGIRPHHASIVVDARGYTLFVRGPEAYAHVNARPVREKAILRLGDVVSLDAVNIILKPDHDDHVRHAQPQSNTPTAGMAAEQNTDPNRQSPPRAVLRGVSGPYFGKVVGINAKLVIGRGADCDLVLDEPEMSRRHAEIHVGVGEIALKDLGSSNGTYVNGVQVHDALLFPGDQIAFDRNRFLIEAPGMPVRRNEPRNPAAAREAHEVTQTLKAIPRTEPTTPHPGTLPAVEARVPAAAEPAKGWSPWWLIGAGALIATAIALLLLGTR